MKNQPINCDLFCLRVEQCKNGKKIKMKEENEKVIIDETFVLKFEDSTQPAKRIKREPTDPEAKESKVQGGTDSLVYVFS